MTHFIVRLIAKLPQRWLRAFGASIAFLAGTMLRVRRGHVEAAMTRAGIPSPQQSARAMYRSLGRSLSELLWLQLPDRKLDDLVRFEHGAREKIERALARGRGLVICASHTGNWDVAACAMALERELVVVTKHLRVAGLDQEWQRIRRERGVTLIPASGAMAKGGDALSRGAMVAMIIDQVPMTRAHTVETEFLGATVYVDKAPATLAARVQAPMIVSAARRGADGRQVLSVLELMIPPKSGRREWIDSATVRATKALEGFIRAHPSEWLWMHRRWKAPAE